MRKCKMNEEDRKKQLAKYRVVPPRQPWELFDAHKFREFLSANNLTFTDLAELTNISRTTIAKAASPSQNIGLDTYVAIILALKLPLGTFLKGEYVSELYKTLLQKIYLPITATILRPDRQAHQSPRGS